MPVPKIFYLFLSCSVLTACTQARPVTRWIEPYQIDVRQGNFVDQDMVSSLKKGMTREQVRYVLGSPLVVDMYRSNRWDYVYLFTPGRGETQKRQLSVYFENDTLTRVEGDVKAASSESDAKVASHDEKTRVIEIETKEK